MMLQRDVETHLWGKADPDRAVSITLDGKLVASGRSTSTGDWKLALPKQPAGGPHAICIDQDGGRPAELSDVLFGEVWMCAGQSNMEMPNNNCDELRKELPTARHPTIRLFLTPHVAVPVPQNDAKGSWQVCDPETAVNFSAAAYCFGVELNEKLKMPIGLIDSSWGGTSCEPWADRETLHANTDFKEAVESSDRVCHDFDHAKAQSRYADQMKMWEQAAAAARAEHRDPPGKPGIDDPCLSPFRPANLFNGMIAPFTPMPIAGAIWYQGESNVGRGAEYRVLLPLLIQSWRTAWSELELPFYFVQIAPYHYRDPKEPSGAACAELWESQLLTLKGVPHTGMAVISDVGDLDNIHPQNKKAVGHRLALWALARTYGQPVICWGPIYQETKIDGDRIRIRFETGGRKLASRDGRPLDWFAIAGDDLNFVAAEAVIDGNSVIVHSDKVANPRFVRFAWHEAAVPNLINKEGLPAAPFRTDNAPMVTQGRLF